MKRADRQDARGLGHRIAPPAPAHRVQPGRQADYTFPDGSPFQGVPTAAATAGLFQDEGIPPANQTVSLTC